MSPPHRMTIVALPRRGRSGGACVASCACGWRSTPSLNAGMAGSLWDRHIEAEGGRKEVRSP